MNRLVGVSFGLLCIVQATLNVSLWLQAGECQPPPSTSPTPTPFEKQARHTDCVESPFDHQQPVRTFKSVERSKLFLEDLQDEGHLTLLG